MTQKSVVPCERYSGSEQAESGRGRRVVGASRRGVGEMAEVANGASGQAGTVRRCRRSV